MTDLIVNSLALDCCCQAWWTAYIRAFAPVVRSVGVSGDSGHNVNTDGSDRLR